MVYSFLDAKFAQFLRSMGYHKDHMDLHAYNLLKKAFMAGAGAVLLKFKDGYHAGRGQGVRHMQDMGREVEFYENNAPADRPMPPPYAYMVKQTPYDPTDPKSETKSSDPQAHWGGWGIGPGWYNPYGWGWGGYGGYGGWGGFPGMWSHNVSLRTSTGDHHDHDRK
jgi:hypothetical protein